MQEFCKKIKSDFKNNKSLYLMILPVIVFFVVFMYVPMYGAIIAFKDYSPIKGIGGSHWVGMKHFARFFSSVYFWRVLKNTFLLSLYSLIWGFPAPIILALLLNEVKGKLFKKTVQTITYLPHFVSLVVIAGLIKNFSGSDGLINDIISSLGGQRMPLLDQINYFRTIFISSDIWQQIGWNSIIYLAALSGVDEQLYEAARIDGANRWKQTINVTLPAISSTIVILLILRLGNLLTIGFEKIILLYNPGIYEVADVISTYVYRTGLLELNWSYSTAIGLFNSLLNFILLIMANRISKRFSETSLW
ncbi:ABC transporter permease [Clostridium grantii]|uniref:Putative aldouronate transport system permease protein n=1 Tax=Clostridium grantii DSM 8605 TaxID=1121316 RepID=A0A1M5XTT6_9CLOT|nr:ABC transporter permease subunit [Clostridium grantii]SHI02663.1 putative aldouronate transport system permease protein [Clostridium grantii DSM 8605]